MVEMRVQGVLLPLLLPWNFKEFSFLKETLVCPSEYSSAAAGQLLRLRQWTSTREPKAGGRASCYDMNPSILILA